MLSYFFKKQFLYFMIVFSFIYQSHNNISLATKVSCATAASQNRVLLDGNFFTKTTDSQETALISYIRSLHLHSDDWVYWLTVLDIVNAINPHSSNSYLAQVSNWLTKVGSVNSPLRAISEGELKRLVEGKNEIGNVYTPVTMADFILAHNLDFSRNLRDGVIDIANYNKTTSYELLISLITTYNLPLERIVGSGGVVNKIDSRVENALLSPFMGNRKPLTSRWTHLLQSGAYLFSPYVNLHRSIDPNLSNSQLVSITLVNYINLAVDDPNILQAQELKNIQKKMIKDIDNITGATDSLDHDFLKKIFLQGLHVKTADNRFIDLIDLKTILSTFSSTVSEKQFLQNDIDSAIQYFPLEDMVNLASDLGRKYNIPITDFLEEGRFQVDLSIAGPSPVSAPVTLSTVPSPIPTTNNQPTSTTSTIPAVASSSDASTQPIVESSNQIRPKIPSFEVELIENGRTKKRRNSDQQLINWMSKIATEGIDRNYDSLEAMTPEGQGTGDIFDWARQSKVGVFEGQKLAGLMVGIRKLYYKAFSEIYPFNLTAKTLAENYLAKEYNQEDLDEGEKLVISEFISMAKENPNEVIYTGPKGARPQILREDL